MIKKISNTSILHINKGTALFVGSVLDTDLHRHHAIQMIFSFDNLFTIISTDNFSKPNIYWNGNNTYIQKESINKDLGIFDDPDSLFKKHSQNLNRFKQCIFKNITRHSMNKNVDAIRKS